VSGKLTNSESKKSTINPVSLFGFGRVTRRIFSFDFSRMKLDFTTFGLILSLAMLSVGFSVGARSILDLKFADPFVHWLPIDLIGVGTTGTERAAEILKYFESTESRKQYSVETIGGFAFQFGSFSAYGKNGVSGYSSFKGRSVEGTDKIVDGVFSDGNGLFGRKFIDSFDIGIIISEEMAHALGIQAQAGIHPEARYILKSVGKGAPYVLPIRGIARKLPYQSDFLITNHLNSLLEKDIGKASLQAGAGVLGKRGKNELDQILRYITIPKGPNRTGQGSLIIGCSVDSAGLDSVNSLIEDYSSQKVDVRLNPAVSWLGEPPADQLPTGCSEFRWKISLISMDANLTINNAVLQQIYEALLTFKGGMLRRYSPTRINLPEKENNVAYDHIAVYVSDLSRWQALNELLGEKFGTQIQTESVNALSNYNFVQKLTEVFLVFIIIISVFCSSLVAYHIFRSYLTRNRYSIGMLKAFGTRPRTFYVLFLLQGLVFLGMLCFLAFSFSLLVQLSPLPYILLTRFSHIASNSNQRFIDILSVSTLFLLAPTILFGMMSIWLAVKKFLRYTPSDLIQGRIDGVY